MFPNAKFLLTSAAQKLILYPFLPSLSVYNLHLFSEIVFTSFQSLSLTAALFIAMDIWIMQSFVRKCAKCLYLVSVPFPDD